jgi:hypothetical protein
MSTPDSSALLKYARAWAAGGLCGALAFTSSVGRARVTLHFDHEPFALAVCFDVNTVFAGGGVCDASDPPACSGEMADHAGLDVALPEPLVIMGSWRRLHGSIDDGLRTWRLWIGRLRPGRDESIQAACDSLEVAVLNGVVIR